MSTVFHRIIETILPLLKDKLMLSGEESSWRVLKEALPTLEELKAKSSILFLLYLHQSVNIEQSSGFCMLIF